MSCYAAYIWYIPPTNMHSQPSNCVTTLKAFLEIVSLSIEVLLKEKYVYVKSLGCLNQD